MVFLAKKLVWLCRFSMDYNIWRKRD